MWYVELSGSIELPLSSCEVSEMWYVELSGSIELALSRCAPLLGLG